MPKSLKTDMRITTKLIWEPLSIQKKRKRSKWFSALAMFPTVINASIVEEGRVDCRSEGYGDSLFVRSAHHDGRAGRYSGFS